MMRGRLLDATDRKDAPMVGVINDVLARKAFGDEDPLGRTIKMFGGGADFTIVGIVGGSRQYRPDMQPEPEVYFAQDQLRWMASMFLTVRTAVDPTTVVGSIRHAIWELDGDVPISDVYTMQHVVSRSTREARFFASLLLGFGGLALLLGSVGVYGVLSYVVSQRTQEIGIRMALGAGRRQVLQDALGWAMRPVLLGIVLGVAGAFAATRLLAGMLFGVSALDPVTFVVVPLVLATVAAAASYLPARRAAHTDPMVALRGD